MAQQARRPPDGIVWTTAEPDMYTCAIEGRTVGFVLRVAGGFNAFDDASNPLGRYQRARAARRSVETIRARRSLE
ncbi:hypothetical protein Q9S71_09135 [Microbacterium sp. KSW4-11]|uniref:Uncharacterized protein n=1 Tax=Microbacterium gawkjiense TaxID=3067309 RepID=A0ABU3GBX2_9MICO|nr:hypothetical protein [Microbacterium sp. KSW4-11]MDT3316986.1 hypothetical protein [Microbacterium sp. KSW4-11]